MRRAWLLAVATGVTLLDVARTAETKPAEPATTGPVRIAKDSFPLHGLAVDARNVYYYGTLLFSVPKGSVDGYGKDIAKNITCRSSKDIAIDANNIYCLGEGHGEIERVPKTGGTAVRLAYMDKGHAYRPGGIATDGVHVYYASELGNKVLRVPTMGGAVQTLFTDKALRFPGPIALDATSVYWVNMRDGSVQRMPKNGGAPRELGSGRGRSFGLAVDAQNAYFTDYDAGKVWRVPIAGGTTTALAEGQGGPVGLAIDRDYVYFANSKDGTIQRVAKAGGPLTQIAAGQEKPSNVAVDDANVYWLNVGGPTSNTMSDQPSSVMRAAKPKP
jgi:hypothetical protein